MDLLLFLLVLLPLPLFLLCFLVKFKGTIFFCLDREELIQEGHTHTHRERERERERERDGVMEEYHSTDPAANYSRDIHNEHRRRRLLYCRSILIAFSLIKHRIKLALFADTHTHTHTHRDKETVRGPLSVSAISAGGQWSNCCFRLQQLAI